MIEKLSETYKTSRDGISWELRPNREGIIEKVNEIIDYLNNQEMEKADERNSKC